MARIADFMPQAPAWQLDWAAIDAAFPWIAAMRGSTQDPLHHAEGDVWTHVGMVTEALVGFPAWRAAPDDERLVLFAAALLHDVAKPSTRRETPGGRVTNPGHSQRGAVDARAILWRMEMPFVLREQVCGIIATHQSPFWLLEREPWQATKLLTATSLVVAPRLVALHAEADAIGRVCQDQGRMLDAVELYRMAAVDLGCLDGPYPFHSAADRMRYFGAPERQSPDLALFDASDHGFVATVTSGLQACGKSTWVAAATATGGELAGQPVISLDGLRLAMGVDPGDKRAQGLVIQEAREQARKLLAARVPFVWESTNISREQRGMLADLFLAYGARLRMVYVEAPAADQASRNRGREAHAVVPEAALERTLRHWEVPSLVECHELQLVVQEPVRRTQPSWRR